MAQQRGGGFDREAMMKRMKEGIRAQLEIKADDEWAIIGEQIDKVMAARTAVPNIRPSFGGFGGGRPGGGAPGGDRGGFGRGGDRGAQGGDQARGGDRGGQRGGDQARGGRSGGGRGGRTGGFGGPTNPKVEALQKAVESGNEGAIKSALEAFRRERDSKQAALEKAQDELRELLTVKQEGKAMTMGLVR